MMVRNLTSANAVRSRRAGIGTTIAAGALVVGGAIGAASVAHGGLPIRPQPEAARATGTAGRTATLVRQALAGTSAEIAFQRTVITRDGAPVMTTEVWVAPDGTTRFESFLPTGSPAVDETFGPSEQGQVVDYERHAWWGMSTPTGIEMTDPHRIATDLAAGVMHVTGTRTVGGQTVTDLTGHPSTMVGSTVDVVISATDLPLSSTSHEPGGLVGRTTYRWLADVEPARAQLGATIPNGLVHLTVPPAGAPGGDG